VIKIGDNIPYIIGTLDIKRQGEKKII
jgi:hypothetical protein